MDFTSFESLDWPPPNAPKVGEVYVLFFRKDGQEVPFYVGQTERFLDRMGDYISAQFGACTDFKVGMAIKFLDELGYRIAVKHKKSADRFSEERTLIVQLRSEGYKLLNDCPAYDYKRTTAESELKLIQNFCRNNY
jgi:hypothetical protein